MERFIGIEKARGNLGRLAQEIADESAPPAVLTRRGRALVVLVGVTDYLGLMPGSAAWIEENVRIDGRP